jgi:hypothetical protein
MWQNKNESKNHKQLVTFYAVILYSMQILNASKLYELESTIFWDIMLCSL